MNIDDNLRLEQELEDLLLVEDDEDNAFDIDQSLDIGIKSSPAYLTEYDRKLQSTGDFNNKLEQNDLESYEDELQQMLRSSQTLLGLQMNESEADTALSDSNIYVEAISIPSLDHSTLTSIPGNASTITLSNSIILSEEDILVIHELIELMVSSVERCAPIYELQDTTLTSNIDVKIFKTDLVNIEQFTIIINDDDDDRLLVNDHHHYDDSISDSNKDLEDTASLLAWNNHLKTELEHEKEYQKNLLLQQDELLWSENNEIKQLIEKQQSEINDRKKKRQLERDNAIKENAIITIQCMYRIRKAKLTRKHLYEYEQIRIAFVQAELEHLHLQELMEKERKLEREEIRLMGVAEVQCRTVWVSCKHIEIEKTKLETINMGEEDRRAHDYRDYMRSLSILQAQYMELTAQEDIEYDLLADDDECDSDSYLSNEEYKQTFVPPSSSPLKETSFLNLNTKAATAVSNDAITSNSLSTTTNKVARLSVSTSKSSITSQQQQHKQAWGGLILSKEATNPSLSHNNNISNSNNHNNHNHNDKSSNNKHNDSNHNSDNHINSSHSLSDEITNSIKDENERTGTLLTGIEIPLEIINNCTTTTTTTNTHFNNNILTQDWFTTAALNAIIIQENRPIVTLDTRSCSKSDFELLELMFNKRSSKLEVEEEGNTKNGFFQVPILQAGGAWVNAESSSSFTECKTTLDYYLLKTHGQHNVDEILIPQQQQLATIVSSEIIIDEEEDQDDGCAQDISSIVDLETNPSLASELDLCVEGLTNMKFLKKFINLKKLVVNVNKIVDFSGILNMRYLVHLSAKDNRICSLNALKEICGLKYLYLDTNRISDLSPLNNLKGLRILSVNSNIIADMPVLQCPNLQRLELYCNRITSVPDQSLLGLPLLTHLDLGSNQIHSISGSAISSCGLLQTLILSQNQLFEVPAPIRLPLLKNLWLNGNKISNLYPWKDESTNANLLQKQPWPLFLPSLTKLFLRDNLISNINSDVMTHFPLLAEIDLSFNQITSRRNLAGIQECRLLAALHVQDNPFTTVPVNNGSTSTANASITGSSSSTSRTALPLVEQVALHTWLLELCPFLDTISNNALNKKDYPIKTLSNYCTEDLIHQYMKTKDWLSTSNNSNNSYDNNSDYLTYVYTDSRLRSFIHLLKMLQVNQTCFNTNEKITKREESKAMKKGINGDGKRINIKNSEQRQPNNNNNNNNEKEVVDWENEYIKLLQNQRVQVMSFIHSIQKSKHYCHSMMHDSKDLALTSHNENNRGCSSYRQGVCMNYFMKYKAASSNITSIISKNKVSTLPDSIKITEQCSNDRNIITASIKNNSTISNEASCLNTGILRFQSLFRGRKIRNKLKAAFKSIRYEDDELDDMLLFNPEEFDFEDYMMQESTLGIVLPATTTEEISRVIGGDVAAVMVYGDHIRKRQSRSSHSEMLDPNNHIAANQAWILPTTTTTTTTYTNTGGGGDDIEQDEPFTRPATSMTTVSTISASSEIPPDSRENYHNSHTQQPSPVPSYNSMMLSSRSVNTKQSKSLSAATAAQEWGISDPKVLATMMKRNQRLKGFADAKEIREQDRDPTARLNKFLKTAHKHNYNSNNNSSNTTTAGNTNTCGSFGGKPKTMRATAGHSNHHRKSMAVPAWMLGSGGDEES